MNATCQQLEERFVELGDDAFLADAANQSHLAACHSCTAIYGALPLLERRDRISRVRDGHADLLYVAPEQLRNPGVRDTLEMREIRYHVVQPGYRSKTITIATTLIDAEMYSKEDIAQLYGFRWNVEVYQADCTSSAGLYQLAA